MSKKNLQIHGSSQTQNRTEGDQIILTQNTSGQYTFNENKPKSRIVQEYNPTDSQVFLKVEEKS